MFASWSAGDYGAVGATEWLEASMALESGSGQSRIMQMADSCDLMPSCASLSLFHHPRAMLPPCIQKPLLTSTWIRQFQVNDC